MARRGGMAYDYNLGLKQQALAERKENVQETRNAQNDRLKEMHENMRDALANQTERLKTATTLFEFNTKMTQMQKEEAAIQDAAHFRRFYGMIKDNDPNRKAQINELFNMFPNAVKIPAVHQDIAEDNKRIDAATKPQLTQAEEKFLKEHGPNSKTSDYATLQKQAADPNDPNHVTSAINYGRTWDLMKKSLGMQSGTPEGINMDDYVKNIQSKFEKLPNGQPNPHYQPPEGTPPPSPSTPAPANAEGWSNATIPDIAQPNVPGQPTAAPTAAPAGPTGQNARDFINSMGFKKTSDAGAAAAASSGRSELNDMLNQTPETKFVAPQPTPTPTPEPNKEQYYTA